MARESVQHLLASGVRSACQKIASVARALVTLGGKRLNLRTFDVSSDELAITSGPPRGTRKKIRRQEREHRNRSRSRHVAVKILSHVWFSCALFVCSFSLTRMAQGFLSCCGAVTGNGFPGHTQASAR